VRCTDDGGAASSSAGRRAGRAALGLAAGLWLAGCATPPPMPGHAGAAAAVGAAPAIRPEAPRDGAPARSASEAARPPVPVGAALPPPVAARSWSEFRLNAGQRLVAAHPDTSYTGDPPAILFGIPVIETELAADGSIRSLRAVRVPTDPEARDTVQLAMAAIRRAAPYGDMTRLEPPWKWVEAFLFDDRRHFKPQSLDE
jgi:hypothetical protein